MEQEKNKIVWWLEFLRVIIAALAGYLSSTA